MVELLQNLKFNQDRLIPAIVQDVRTRRVLMLGFMNKESLEKTILTRQVTFYSRRRQCLWTKGETSGNFLVLENIVADCDRDTLLLEVIPGGPVCHRGTDTCFGIPNQKDFVSRLEDRIRSRRETPGRDSYCTRLFEQGLARIAQKLGEESTELIIAAIDQEKDSDFLEEAADLFFHLLVLLVERGKGFADLLGTLRKRAGEWARPGV